MLTEASDSTLAIELVVRGGGAGAAAPTRTAGAPPNLTVLSNVTVRSYAWTLLAEPRLDAVLAEARTVGGEDARTQAILEDLEDGRRTLRGDVCVASTTCGGFSWRADAKVLNSDGRSESEDATGLRGGR